MDGGQRRTETWTRSRMERVSRVEPAAVRLAGGERSAKHRFPRGAAGIDKGSAAAPLVPFTAPVRKIFRRTHGERNNTTKAICAPHCRMAAPPYPAYAVSAIPAHLIPLPDHYLQLLPQLPLQRQRFLGFQIDADKSHQRIGNHLPFRL